MRKKNPISVLILFFSLAIGSCGGTKNMGDGQLYGATWELDYISGPRIAFEGLFPDKRPKVAFDKATNLVSGNAGCNGYSAAYELRGNTIAFGEPGPTTMMYCGEGEGTFLRMMGKVNAYVIDADNKLNLMIDNVPMLRFKRIE